jgi:hypothetical protein
VRPGHACPQCERRSEIEQQQPIEAPAEFAPRIGRVARVESERVAAAIEIIFGVARGYSASSYQGTSFLSARFFALVQAAYLALHYSRTTHGHPI